MKEIMKLFPVVYQCLLVLVYFIFSIVAYLKLGSTITRHNTRVIREKLEKDAA